MTLNGILKFLERYWYNSIAYITPFCAYSAQGSLFLSINSGEILKLFIARLLQTIWHFRWAIWATSDICASANLYFPCSNFICHCYNLDELIVGKNVPCIIAEVTTQISLDLFSVISSSVIYVQSSSCGYFLKNTICSPPWSSEPISWIFSAPFINFKSSIDIVAAWSFSFTLWVASETSVFERFVCAQ